MPENRETLIEFPCLFPIKVMGVHHPEYEDIILAVVQEHAPDTKNSDISIRASSKGNYLGATVHVWAVNQEQLDNIYRALTGHELVKVVY